MHNPAATFQAASKLSAWSRLVARVYGHLLLLVTPQSIAILQASGWQRSQQPPTLLAHWQANAPLTSADLAQQLHSMLQHLRSTQALPRGCHLLLADQWARYFLSQAAQNSRRISDCEAAAQMRFLALYGDPPQDWQIQAQWHASQAFLCCALPRSLLQPLQQAVLNSDGQVLSSVPYLIDHVNQLAAKLAKDGWLMVFAQNHLQLLAFAQGQLKAVHQTSIDASFWQDQAQNNLQRMLQRDALRLNLSLPALLQLAGCVPLTWQKTATLNCNGTEIQIQYLPAAGLANRDAAMHSNSALNLLHGAWQ